MSLNCPDDLCVGVGNYTMEDWLERCEYNVDLDYPNRIIHFRTSYTLREHHILGHLALTLGISINKLVISILKASGVFDNRVDYCGRVEYLKIPKLDTDIDWQKTKKPEDITGQALLFGDMFRPKRINSSKIPKKTRGKTGQALLFKEEKK